jgi:hypothetical protein
MFTYGMEVVYFHDALLCPFAGAFHNVVAIGIRACCCDFLAAVDLVDLLYGICVGSDATALPTADVWSRFMQLL